MSYGLKLKNSQNQTRLDTTDRITRLVTTFTGTRYADAATYSVLNNQVTGVRALYSSYFYLPYPGITLDGTWAGLIKNITPNGGQTLEFAGISEFLTAYCVMEVDRCILVVQTCGRNLYFPANNNSPIAYTPATLTYNIDLVRF